MIIHVLAVSFIGFAAGLTVGAGFVAFLTVLGIIPRLTQLSKTIKKIFSYEWAVVLGAVAGALATIRDPVLHLSPLFLIPLGLAGGVFIGLLAAALTEVLNVFPILAKRVGLEERIISLLMAIVLGKVFGSLFHWLYFVDH
ncbi:stage V sporulation protein AB [Bacillus canaveralius]|uniref:Stage V sporulation protein AB n=1 Tax=Bacillus canaveralius TaxID=1403243 RepID=A0A2N5GRK7_9BACI|nr:MULTISPECIES: stage V sporulation protein AB [Bacillus]PLR84563.1 stage V sporulation protein AB [Bacillus sp. V33-4]PLR86077.1 stage V sporulation protein AB [Bacillus canaveralius]PLS00197.1 stage V sporulation protein AB [Bacillus canaveralius]RSK52039.1 stage V sporulation protein AB [Bacillus canaveralius]